jgi:hypothetical protein
MTQLPIHSMAMFKGTTPRTKSSRPLLWFFVLATCLTLYWRDGWELMRRLKSQLFGGKPAMLTVGEQDKVLNPVVILVSVDVVDMLSPQKSPAHLFFHEQSVKTLPPAFNINYPITQSVQTALGMLHGRIVQYRLQGLQA